MPLITEANVAAFGRVSSYLRGIAISETVQCARFFGASYILVLGFSTLFVVECATRASWSAFVSQNGILALSGMTIFYHVVISHAAYFIGIESWSSKRVKAVMQSWTKISSTTATNTATSTRTRRGKQEKCLKALQRNIKTYEKLEAQETFTSGTTSMLWTSTAVFAFALVGGGILAAVGT